ncbi:MAG: peptidase S16 [Alphaproteobacteria bacterium]|nr:peptidase S16 [Alphaproteobacteria bacterium]
MGDAFETALQGLPGEIPVFPLPRVILLPRVQLPLNIFEPRYVAMTQAALACPERLIGMIQPRPDGDGEALFNTGCAGRITAFEETPDGRYLITLTGVCRFNVAQEIPADNKGFRKVRADWQPYAGDLQPDTLTDVCRDGMMARLRVYLDKMNMSCDRWDAIRNIECEKLISTLSVVCPFDCDEKQALLEAKTLPDRVQILQALLDLAAREGDCADTCH